MNANTELNAVLIMKEYYAQILILIIAGALTFGIMYLLIWFVPAVVLKYLSVLVLAFIVFAPFITEGVIKIYNKLF